MCIHHWRIAPAEEAESTAVCKKCGEERVFSNEVRTGRERGFRARPEPQTAAA
jgi:hypothetical protein